MSAIDPEHCFIEDFNSRTKGAWSSHSRYERVTALFLSWQDDDLGVGQEIARLSALFESEFAFATEFYKIPSENPDVELAYRLASFVRTHAVGESSLSIFYYGGHADSPEDGSAPRGYPQLRAKSSGGPTLDWYPVQNTIYNARGDVLVLLDCCHAAPVTYGFRNTQMEILAASSSGRLVPKPGARSFTSILIREIRNKLNADGSVPVRWLHKRLYDPNTQPSLIETPFYVSLAKEDMRTISLAPLPQSIPSGFSRKEKPPSSMLIMTVSLDEDPTGRQIAQWLKGFPPSIVRSVDVEALVTKARLLQSLTSGRTPFSGSCLGQLSSSAQVEIVQKIADLSGIISRSALLAQGHSKNDTVDGQTALETIRDMESSVEIVYERIEQGVLLEPSLDLQAIAVDTVVRQGQFEESIGLRQQVLSSAISSQVELSHSSITWDTKSGTSNSSSRFRFGKFNDQQIIMELSAYNMSSPDSREPTSEALEHFKRTTELLCHPKQSTFHILPGLGYIQETHLCSFGLVFVLDESYDITNNGGTPQTLADLLSKHKRVPLGRRIALAHALSQALEQFHLVGWVHKSVKSSNVLCLLNNNQNDEEAAVGAHIGQPLLFGFEYSRPEDAGTSLRADFCVEDNFDKHPDRWGRPRVKFEKSHDVYSLGIMLAEIFFWKRIKDFQEANKRPLDPENFQSGLISRISKDCPHMIGQCLTDSIVACLKFKDLTQSMNDFERHRFYQENVMEPKFLLEPSIPQRYHKIASLPKEFIGATGRRYVFKELIQERPGLGRIWLATSRQDKFVLKDTPRKVFSSFNENIRPRLRDCTYARLPWDTIPDQDIFVYKYLTADFLTLVRKQIPIKIRKQILKDSLKGIAELHNADVVHLDIKPDNIMINYSHLDPVVAIEQVQIADLENAAYISKGRCIKGMLAGNDNWRSPEAHFKGELSKPTDIFSFGAVCIYAMLGRVVFGPDDDFAKHQEQGALPALIRLQRQVSYFGDREGLNGLMKHVGDEEVNCQILRLLWEERNEEHIPYQPFSDWTEVDDAEFKDLVLSMMNLDPTKRITARQALEHAWFKGSEID